MSWLHLSGVHINRSVEILRAADCIWKRCYTARMALVAACCSKDSASLCSVRLSFALAESRVSDFFRTIAFLAILPLLFVHVLVLSVYPPRQVNTLYHEYVCECDLDLGNGLELPMSSVKNIK